MKQQTRRNVEIQKLVWVFYTWNIGHPLVRPLEQCGFISEITLFTWTLLPFRFASCLPDLEYQRHYLSSSNIVITWDPSVATIGWCLAAFVNRVDDHINFFSVTYDLFLQRHFEAHAFRQVLLRKTAFADTDRLNSFDRLITSYRRLNRPGYCGW